MFKSLQALDYNSKEDIELLAQMIHDSNRQAVEEGNVLVNMKIGFKEWEELDEKAKQGRRSAALYLLDRCLIVPKQ